MNILLTFCNSLLYCGTFYYFWKKNKKVNIGILVLSLWSLSAICGIYYCQTDLHKWNHTFTLLPFIYVFLLFMISIFPLLNLKEWKIQNISTNIRLINKLAILISIIAIIPFYENLIQLFYTIQSGSDEMIEVLNSRYRDETYDQYYYMSDIGKKLTWYNNNLGIVSNCLFLYYISFFKKNKILITGLLISILTTYLAAYNTSARYIIVKNMLLLVFYGLIFYRFMNYKTQKKLIKYSVIVIGSFITMTMIISIFRYSDIMENKAYSYSMLDWLSLYLSEGFLNFNGDMWYIKDYLWGRNTMFLERYMFDITQHVEGRDFVIFESIVKIPMNYFYTMIGDFYVDFGPWLTPIIITCISFIFCKFCKYSQNMLLSKLILIGVWGKACLIGFTYYTYHGDEYQTLFTPLIYLIVLLFENKNNQIILVKQNEN